jgi:hypothetical protein
MMVFTDTRYRPISRNRKKLPPKPKRAKREFVPYVPKSTVYRPETKQYPSVLSKVADTTKRDESYKQEISKKYTLAPAYNKGAYQVISNDNVKDIGK